MGISLDISLQFDEESVNQFEFFDSDFLNEHILLTVIPSSPQLFSLLITDYFIKCNALLNSKYIISTAFPPSSNKVTRSKDFKI